MLLYLFLAVYVYDDVCNLYLDNNVLSTSVNGCECENEYLSNSLSNLKITK